MSKIANGNTKVVDVDIAIIGGGIVGVVLSLGLIRRGIHVTVYEQASSFREIGLGVAFSANAIECMRRIHPDIEAALRAVATSNGDADDPNNLLRFVDGYNQVSDEEPRKQRPLFDLDMGKGAFEGCHRAHLLAELAKNLPQETVVFRKRLTALDVEGSESHIKLVFEDGTSAHADAVIGCDGIKSRVRQILLGETNPASYPTYSNHVCYRALVPMDRAVGGPWNSFIRRSIRSLPNLPECPWEERVCGVRLWKAV